MSGRERTARKLREPQICCVCIHKSLKSCSSAMELLNQKQIGAISTMKILLDLNLLQYEVNNYSFRSLIN